MRNKISALIDMHNKAINLTKNARHELRKFKYLQAFLAGYRNR